VSLHIISQRLRLKWQFKFLFPSVTVVIVYWLANLNPDPARFFTFWLLIVTISAQAIGLFIGAATPSSEISLALLPFDTSALDVDLWILCQY
jgi:hypothetical protein